MVVLSSCFSAKVSKMSRQEYKGYKWQAPSNTVRGNKKFCVDQVIPPPWRGQGVGQDRGGGYKLIPIHYKGGGDAS